MAIGLHILQQIQMGRDHLDRTIARLGRTAPYLVLNEHKLALELRAKGYDVLFRHAFPGDSEYRGFDVDRYWSVNGPLAEAGITVVWLNEPAINNTEDALLLLDAYQRTSRARPPGARMCVINAAVGTPHESRITSNGEVALLLREIVKNGDVLGLHEYAPQLADTDELKIRPWYLGRYRFWMDRCRGLGIAPPRVIITEFAYDTGGGSNDGWQGRKAINAEAYAALLLALRKRGLVMAEPRDRLRCLPCGRCRPSDTC